MIGRIMLWNIAVIMLLLPCISCEGETAATTAPEQGTSPNPPAANPSADRVKPEENPTETESGKGDAKPEENQTEAEAGKGDADPGNGCWSNAVGAVFLAPIIAQMI